MLAGHGGQEADFVLPGLVPFVMVQMARVVTDLIDVRRHQFRQAIVLLQIDGQVGRTLPADFRQGLGVCGAVGRDADHVGPGLRKRVTLLDRGVDILGAGGRHALNGDGLMIADHHRADSDSSRWISGQIHGFLVGTAEKIGA